MAISKDVEVIDMTRRVPLRHSELVIEEEVKLSGSRRRIGVQLRVDGEHKLSKGDVEAVTKYLGECLVAVGSVLVAGRVDGVDLSVDGLFRQLTSQLISEGIVEGRVIDKEDNGDVKSGESIRGTTELCDDDDGIRSEENVTERIGSDEKVKEKVARRTQGKAGRRGQATLFPI